MSRCQAEVLEELQEWRNPGPGSFDALAAARNAFAFDTHLAWRMVTGFRKAWSLEIREPGLTAGGGPGTSAVGPCTG